MRCTMLLSAETVTVVEVVYTTLIVRVTEIVPEAGGV